MDDYDVLADEYSVYEQASVTDWALGLSKVFDLISPMQNKTILDYGCGTGRFSKFLSNHGGKHIGVDISKNMIEIAKLTTTNANIDYHAIKSGELPFLENNSINLITTNYVTCTISSAEEITKIFTEMYRVLQDDGYLIILDNNWEVSHGREFISHALEYQPNLQTGQKVEVILKSNPPLRIQDHFWSKNDYCNMLQQANFSIHAIEQPLATNNDHNWIDETAFSPSLIIIAKKPSNAAHNFF